MDGIIKFQNANLHYRDEGKGNTVVLLHGYLESMDIWGSFKDELSRYYRVVTIDLPGHGKSDTVCEIHTMEIMADAVEIVLKRLDIGRAVIIGHSMGGYVTLAFAEIFPEKTVGFGLFHSHGFDDSEEKKANRDREIELVESGKKIQIFKINIPRTFANDNLRRLSDEVKKSGEIALATAEKGIVCALKGMKIRPDRRKVLMESVVPVLIIAGKKDNYIPFGIYEQHFNLAPKTSVLILENSGHMGFIEEKEKSLEGVLKFLGKIYH
jgi:pimeloyl-ACP methyl ester carboxylesterase